MIIFKKNSLKVIFLFSLLLFLGCVSSPEVSVDVLPSYERLFENKTGWTGADGAYSLPLPNNLVLWLFGDTWIGEIVNGEHVNATIVNNSIAIQRGRAPPEASIEFFFPTSPGKDGQAFIQPADGRGWLWIYHGALTRQGMYLFLVQIERVEKPPGAGFKVIGSWLGHVANPGDAPMVWKLTQYRIPWGSFSSSAATLFGSWVLQKGRWLYIYGTTEDVIDGIHHKYMILARAPESGLEDFKQWRFYDNGEWSTDFVNAERLCGGMANEFSVSFLPALGKYIVVYSDGGSSKNIVARFAPNPWGPWSNSMVLYQCPEQQWGESIFCYAAKGHPAISKAPDEIIVTYIASSADFETLTTDARLYRPRFLRMKFRR